MKSLKFLIGFLFVSTVALSQPTAPSPFVGWKILKPVERGKPFDVAAEEFQKYYERCTGEKLDIITEPNETDNLIVIGSDAVNRFARTAIESKIISPFRIRTGTDDYHILSANDGKRNLLFLAGGRGRATLYAVYHFFETRGGCSWFWDGDVVPKSETLDMSGLDIAESPRFEYRGLRYFAHRSLHRFQAEHWGPEDWEQEIDWMVKKRLNVFMLRIGQDDMFQKAFPGVVPYPDNDKPLPEAIEGGYDDRTTFWSLQYRGELRRHILQYAFDRDLMHPEDFGTMTHWYSRTPLAFLEKYKPSFLAQASGGYSEQTGLVWDIRDDKYLDLYFQLTKTHVEHYGKPELFHTIGLAERNMFKDRSENLEIKLHTYRRLIAKLRESYPNAPILLGGWDFLGWKAEEIPELLRELDPSRTIIWDYEADINSAHNFTNWGIVGKFPYVFGIFEALNAAADIRANYNIIEERIAVAADDPFCKGYIFWPEMSHADILILEYFPWNAWRPDQPNPIHALERLCRTRYPNTQEKMETIWKTFLPMTYPNVIGGEWHPQILWHLSRPAQFFSQQQDWGKIQRDCRRQLASAPQLFRMLTELPFDTPDPFLLRDVIDIARTTTKNLTILAIADLNIAMQNQLSQKDVQRAGKNLQRLVELFRDLLSLHEDYSLNATYERLHTVTDVNPCFAKTLVANAANSYCASYQYELFDHLYLPIILAYVDAANSNAKKRTNISSNELEALQQVYNHTWQTVRNTPLKDMKSQQTFTVQRYHKIMSLLATSSDSLLTDKK